MNTQTTDALEVENLDTLSPDEQKKLFDEMDELFANHSANVHSSLKLGSKEIPLGLKFPIIFNILLISFVTLAVILALIFLQQRDKEVFNSLNILQESSDRTNLALKIIAEKTQALDKRNEEIDKIQAQLDALLRAQQGKNTTYNSKIQKFKNDFENQLDLNITTFENELQVQSISEAEIQRRLDEQETLLRIEFEKELTSYIDELESEKLEEEAQLANQISNVQLTLNTKQTEVVVLKEEIQAREINLDTTISTDTDDTSASEIESALIELRQKKEEREKAFREFEIYHDNIINTVSQAKFDQAREEVVKAIINVTESPYQDHLQAQTYLKTFNTYGMMLDTTIAGRAIQNASADELSSLLEDLEIESVSVDDLRTQILEQENIIAQQNKKISEFQNLQISNASSNADQDVLIQNLRARIAGQKNTIAQQNEEITESSEIQTFQLQNDDGEFEAAYLQLLAEYEAAQINATDIRQQAYETILQNIIRISDYLALKKSGIDDEAARNVILEIANEFPIYQTVIDVIVNAIDPSGRLSF